ncbi:SRPBCC domain-containing protein [uncultured Jatrophihabitans sp.]|uniref:SRPBCC domain-containing protein n=1 Tax=uncultured Jatrophihabitans sp. TaxID=1610747 RepID=UPI0035CB6B36
MTAPASVHVEHSAPVDASVADAWRALQDPERVTGALPGGRLGTTEDGVTQGRLKVRFGAIAPTYRGTARLVEHNARAHRVVLELRGDDARDVGTISATVSATVRRSGETVALRVVADVELTGRAAQLSRDKQRTAVRQVIDRFADALVDANDEGDDVTDESSENASPEAAQEAAARRRRRPSPGPAGDAEAAPPVEASAPQPAEQPLDDPSAVETSSAAEPEPGVEAVPLAAEPSGTPSFGTPGGIPVPSLSDEPSVNGHLPAAGGTDPDEPPLARMTRQAMAKRVAPVALGIVFVLAAARRRRGRSA